jgi:hypothetical protein
MSKTFSNSIPSWSGKDFRESQKKIILARNETVCERIHKDM